MRLQRGRRARTAVTTAGIGLVAAFTAVACGSIPAQSGNIGGTGAVGVPTGDDGAPTAGGGTSAGRDSGGHGDGSGVPRCRADQLQVDLGRVGPAAGNRYVPLVFTNDSGHTCGLSGYAGVTVLDGDKEQIGPDAERAPGNPVTTVSLAPGESASSLLHWASGVAGDCRQSSTYLRTFPPGSYEAIIIPADIKLCGDVFDVRAVTAGTDGIAG